MMFLSAMSAGEIFSTGGITTAIGILMTFAVLGLLIVCISIPSILKKKKSKAASPVEAVKEVKSEEPVVSSDDSGELVAAITAAISMILSEENAEPISKARAGFRVRTIKRI